MRSFGPVLNTQRIRQRSCRLSNSIVMGTLGEGETTGGEILVLKSKCFETIDYVVSEMKRRFDENSEILMAIAEAKNLFSDQFDRNVLLPLNEIGLVIPSEAEINVFKEYMLKEKRKPDYKEISILKMLFPIKEAFAETYNLFDAIETIASSTAINECSFSALSRVDSIRRMSMTDQRLRDLSFIAFEKKRMDSLDLDILVEKFSQKNRRLAFF